MRRTSKTRVIVGVDTSMAGLRALRLATGEARSRNAELHAVRAWNCNPGGRGAFAGWYDELERLASKVIDAAFADTMGGLPEDVDVVCVTMIGPPGRALVKYANRDEDLLVVGTAHRARPWRPLRRSVPRYCAAHAKCPLLVVPPDAFARQVSREGPARSVRRELPQLISRGGDPTRGAGSGR